MHQGRPRRCRLLTCGPHLAEVIERLSCLSPEKTQVPQVSPHASMGHQTRLLLTLVSTYLHSISCTTNRLQAIYLNASTSVDEDDIHSLPMAYAWRCADESTGSACVSPSRETLDMSSFAEGALLSIPGGSLPIGERATSM